MSSVRRRTDSSLIGGRIQVQSVVQITTNSFRLCSHTSSPPPQSVFKWWMVHKYKCKLRARSNKENGWLKEGVGSGDEGMRKMKSGGWWLERWCFTGEALEQRPEQPVCETVGRGRSPGGQKHVWHDCSALASSLLVTSLKRGNTVLA